MYLANLLGFSEVYIYEDEVDNSIYDFVSEAKKRNIYHIKDLTLLSHEQFIKKWDGYCDEYFKKVKP